MPSLRVISGVFGGYQSRDWSKFFALLVTILTGAASVSSSEPPANQLLPAAIFFQPPDFSLPKLSPDGSKVCAITRYSDTETALTLIELPSKQSRILARSAGMSVANFWWKGNDLMLILVNDMVGGRNFRSLDLRTGKVNDLPDLRFYETLRLVNRLSDDPKRLLFLRGRLNTRDRMDLVKIDISSGAEEVVERDPVGIAQWYTNVSGNAVAAVAFDGTLYWRDGTVGRWQPRSSKTKSDRDLVVLAVAPDQRRLIVKDFSKDEMARLSYYDPASDITEEICEAREAEPDYATYWGDENVVSAIVYSAGKDRHVFFNKDGRILHEWLERALPGTIHLPVSFSQDNQRAVIYAYNDRNPGVYLVADLPEKKLIILGPKIRGINPSTSMPTRDFTFKSSDGLTITGRLTQPNTPNPAPLVVHLGATLSPEANAENYRPLAQFLASRGYAVAEIFYRGSEGRGRAFREAGDFQVMSGMGRDISEAVQWLGEQHLIDGSRNALFAEADAGLVAFSLACKSTLFKALVCFDLSADTSRAVATRFATSSRPLPELHKLIGGRLNAEAYAKSCSPVRQVPSLAAPSFYFYSRNAMGQLWEDERLMTAALKNAGKTYILLRERRPEDLHLKRLVPWKEEAFRVEAAAEFLDVYLRP